MYDGVPEAFANNLYTFFHNRLFVAEKKNVIQSAICNKEKG
jgi:hypothetical protein